jgi:hypothetical protein
VRHAKHTTENAKWDCIMTGVIVNIMEKGDNMLFVDWLVDIKHIHLCDYLNMSKDERNKLQNEFIEYCKS